MTRSVVGAALCFSHCPTARSHLRTGNAAVRSRTISPLCHCSRPTSEEIRNAFFSQRHSRTDRTSTPCSEAFGGGVQRADGCARQDTHGARKFLEGAKTARPKQSLHPRQSPPGNGQPAAGPRDLRKTDGDG